MATDRAVAFSSRPSITIRPGAIIVAIGIYRFRR
jgi:hypothetical protein